MHKPKKTFGRRCTEGAEQHSNFGARAHDARLWANKPAHTCHTAVKKILEWNSLNSALNWMFCRSAWAGYGTCRLNKPKEELEKPKWGRKLIPFPSGVANLLRLFCHLNEQNRGAYKLSWVS
jgi:hypothetical protein